MTESAPFISVTFPVPSMLGPTESVRSLDSSQRIDQSLHLAQLAAS
jgi:hypothetical protein